VQEPVIIVRSQLDLFLSRFEISDFFGKKIFTEKMHGRKMLEEELYQRVVKHGTFLLKSGQTSSVYADFRVLTQTPRLMTQVCYELSKLIQDPKADFVVVGIPLGGIPFATLVASILGKPMWLVRPQEQEKQHGLTEQKMEENKKKKKQIVLIEDVITVGTSVARIATQLQDKGFTIVQIVTILDRRPKQGPLNDIPVSSLLNHHFLEGAVCSRVKTVSVKESNAKEVLIKAKQRTQSSLIAAIDVVEVEKAMQVIRLVAPHVCAIKLHLDIFSAKDQERIQCWVSIWKEVHGFLVIEDRKFADIGHIMALQAKRLPSYVDMITCHGITGRESLRALDELGIGLLPVLQLSTANNLIDPLYETRMMDAINGCKNIAGIIAQHPVPGYLTLSPGVNFEQKADNKGQRYRDASEVQADFFIVGRGLYEAENISDAANRYRMASNKPLNSKL